MALVIDQVTDNGDNSLTIVGHDGDTIYETSAGRKSDLPDKQSDQMAYYKQIVADSIPPDTMILYKNPSYAPNEEKEDE